MSNSINLIQKQTGKDEKDQLAQKIRTISFILLISVGLISILVFLLTYRFSLGYVKSQENKLLSKMSSYEQLGSKIFLLNTRLSDISLLLSSRKKYNELSDLIIGVKPDGFTITKYQIDQAGIAIQANSTSISDVDSFLNSLLQLSKNKKISVVQINSLTANQTRYEVQLTLN